MEKEDKKKSEKGDDVKSGNDVEDENKIEEVEERANDNIDDNFVIPSIDHERKLKTQHNFVKTFSIGKLQVKISVYSPINFIGDFIV